jgi:integrase
LPRVKTPKRARINVISRLQRLVSFFQSLRGSENLTSATEIKTVAGEEKDSLIEYAWLQKKRGNQENTIEMRVYILASLKRKGAKLNNPDSVETLLATEPMTKVQKFQAVNCYRSYTKTMKIPWEPIKVKYEPKQAFIPTHEELLLFLNAAGCRTGPFLQVAYDTGARCGEICRLKWTDINTENYTISLMTQRKTRFPERFMLLRKPYLGFNR